MDFHLPPVGEGLIEVELVRWLVRPGDEVSRGQGLMEVMSDKATMEVPAPFAGTIGDLRATPGTKVQVGQTVLAFTPVGEPALARRLRARSDQRHGAHARPAMRRIPMPFVYAPSSPVRASDHCTS